MYIKFLSEARLKKTSVSGPEGKLKRATGNLFCKKGNIFLPNPPKKVKKKVKKKKKSKKNRGRPAGHNCGHSLDRKQKYFLVWPKGS